VSNDAGVELRRASFRLALVTGVLLVVLLAITAVTVLYVVDASQREASGRQLEDVTRNVDEPNEAPSGVWVVIVAPDGSRSASPGLPSGLPDEQALEAVASGAEPTTTHVVSNGRDYLVRTATARGRVVQAIQDEHENAEELGRVAKALAIAGGTAVVLSSLLAIWLARRAMQPMARALALQRKFVMDASHELRTPLTLLSTRVQLLKRKIGVASNDDVLKDVDGVIDDSRELTEILDDLLIIADTREKGLREPVDLAALADSVVERAAPLARQRGITVQRTGDGAERTGERSGAVTDGAPVALGRAIVALVDNAIAFASSRVTVAVETSSGHITIAVSDDGPGFPPGAAETVFERFASHRDPQLQTGGRPHYGLGLALVAEVAERHGGSVSIADAAGGGSVVSVRLPARGEDPRHR
jgi:signal transduction histidine kinase